MSERRTMELGDWLNATVNVAIGVLLGLVVHGLAQIVAGGSWLIAAMIVVLNLGVFLLVIFFDKLVDRFYPVRFRVAKNPKPEPPKPLARVLSLPAGFILGVLLALLGLDSVILDLLA